MNPPSWEVLGQIGGWLISLGLLGWIVRARKLTIYEDLDKRYVKKEDLERDWQGFRSAMSTQATELARKVDSAGAQAGLAVQNADNALAKAVEVAQVVERVHERELSKLNDRMDEQGEKLTTLLGQLIKLNTQFNERFPRRTNEDRDDSR